MYGYMIQSIIEAYRALRVTIPQSQQGDSKETSPKKVACNESKIFWLRCLSRMVFHSNGSFLQAVCLKDSL